MNKAIFLDRDGIINVDKSYVFRFEDIQWMPGIFELIEFANKSGYKVIVLTNQSGIERGYYTDQDVIKLHQQMSNFLKEKNLIIDSWYYASASDSEDRKPKPGMMIKAKTEFKIDLANSFMIGDKESDIIQLTGPEYLIVKGSYDLSNIPKTIKIFNNLSEVLDYLKSKN